MKRLPFIEVYMLAFDKYKNARICTKCWKAGMNVNIHIHHKDGNPLNNKEVNLQILCASCHKSLHNKNMKRTKKKEFFFSWKYGDKI